VTAGPAEPTADWLTLYLEALGNVVLTAEEPRAELVLRLLPGLSLSGVVRGPGGTPLAGAWVVARMDHSAGLPRGLALMNQRGAWTRGDGSFVLGGLRPGVTWSIDISLSNVSGWKDPRARPQLLDVVTGVRPDGTGLELVLDDMALYGGRAQVRATDAQTGEPISAPAVVAWELHGGRLRRAAPNPRLEREELGDGAVLLDGLPTAYPCMLVVSANGYADGVSEAFEAQREPASLEVALAKLAPLRLRIVGPDGMPATFVSVTGLHPPLAGMEAEDYFRLRSASTDTEGRATLAGAERQPVAVVAQAAGLSTGVVVVTPRNDTMEEVELRLLGEPVTGGVEVIVCDPPSVPVAGVRVILSSQGLSEDLGWRTGATRITAQTGRDGVARVAALPSGMWWATVEGDPWFDNAIVAVAPGETASVVLLAD